MRTRLFADTKRSVRKTHTHTNTHKQTHTHTHTSPLQSSRPDGSVRRSRFGVGRSPFFITFCSAFFQTCRALARITDISGNSTFFSNFACWTTLPLRFGVTQVSWIGHCERTYTYPTCNDLRYFTFLGRCCRSSPQDLTATRSQFRVRFTRR